MNLFKHNDSQNETVKISFFIALILSFFVIHLPLFFFLSHQDLATKRDISSVKNTPKDKVVMIDLNQLPHQPKRIADIDKPSVQKKPDQASAQALYDSSVKEETVAPHQAKTPQGSPVQNQQTPEKKVQKLVQKKPDQPSKTFEQEQPLSMQQKLKLLQQEHKQDQEKKYEDLFQAQQDEKMAMRTNLGAPSGGASGDFFPDYKIGSRTYLNTLANPYIGYYVELRRKFRFAFNPVPVLRNRINQISTGQISVVWGVSVDENGNLKDLSLIRSSGLDDYDQEAKRTISSSAPFSKPPGHMLQPDDKMLHMAWTFVVYLGS